MQSENPDPASQRIEQFRSKGFKITPQRAGILTLMVDSGRHWSAEDVFQSLRDEYPMISRTTVYRNLESLVVEGLLARLQHANRAVLYDANLDQHHHFFCLQCGAIADLYLDKIDYEIDPIRTDVLPSMVLRPELQLHGFCEDCAGVEL